MYRGPRFGFFPFIIFLPLFMFGGLFNVLFSLIPIILIVIFGVYLIRIIITAIANRNKGSNKSFTSTNDNHLEKTLKSYFKENKKLPITSNVEVISDNYNSYSDLYIGYKGNKVDSLIELKDIDEVSYLKLSNLIDDFSSRGKVALKAKLQDYSYVVSKDKKPYKEEYTNAGTLSKASMKEVNGDFDNVYDAYKNLIENVSYGSENSKDYVKGHKAGLDKCFELVYENNKDIKIAEDSISKELETYESTTIEQKGYYDGLFYSLKAIKKAKEYILRKIAKEINSEL